jgi:hypothetical protein
MDELKLNYLPIPEGKLAVWIVADIEAGRIRLMQGAYAKDGIAFWKSNDRPVPPDVFRDAWIELPDGQAEADKRHTAAFLADYRKRMANYTPSAEELGEMRAAFGPGETVIDIITGQRIKL